MKKQRLKGKTVHIIYKERGVGSYVNVEMKIRSKVLVSQRHLETALGFRQETNFRHKRASFQHTNIKY